MRLTSLITFCSLLHLGFTAEFKEEATNAMHEWIVTRSASEPSAIHNFLQNGADPNAPNPLDSNHVPLMTVASPVFYPELAIVLIENGAVVDERVIEWVLSSAKVDILLYYLRQASSELIRMNQDEHMCRAIKRYGQKSIINWREENCWDCQAIKPLIEEFELEVKEKHLILAIKEHCPHEMISKLIELSKLPVSNELMRTCILENTTVLQILIDAGGDPNFQDTETGLTPLIQACRYWMPETALCLLSLGADPCKSAYDGQMTALEHLPGFAKDIHLACKIILLMIKNGLTLDAVPPSSLLTIPECITELVRVLPLGYALVEGGVLDGGSLPALMPWDVLQLIMHILMQTLPPFTFSEMAFCQYL